MGCDFILREVREHSCRFVFSPFADRTEWRDASLIIAPHHPKREAAGHPARSCYCSAHRSSFRWESCWFSLAADVRLGQGYFAYRYSPVRGMRTTQAIPAVIVGAPRRGGAVMGMIRRERKYRVAAKGERSLACLVAGGVWIWFAPVGVCEPADVQHDQPVERRGVRLEARRSVAAGVPAFSTASEEVVKRR